MTEADPEPPSSDERESARTVGPWRDVVVVLVGFLVAGALAGVVWEWVWSPPPGFALEGKWVQDGGGLRDSFSGTGTYVVVAAVSGILLGALAGLLFDRSELATLITVAVGALLAGWVMHLVGEALGPPDPDPIAQGAADYTTIPGELTLSGRSPWVAFPGGALIGLMVVLFGLNGRRRSAT